MRLISKIILHCSASMEGIALTGRDIMRMHTNPISQGGRGWKNPGYHYVVRLNGTIDQILPDHRIANGVKGHNAESIHICYVGGLMQREQGTGKSEKSGQPRVVAANTMTPAQHKAILHLLSDLHQRYPDATLHGHNEFAAKACPGFRVKDVFPDFPPLASSTQCLTTTPFLTPHPRPNANHRAPPHASSLTQPYPPSTPSRLNLDPPLTTEHLTAPHPRPTFDH